MKPAAFRATGMLLLVMAAVVLAASAPADDVAAVMAQIEGAQPGGSGELATLPLAQVMDKLRVPGVSVAVIKDFQIHWSKAYGIADVVSGAKVDTGTLFQAASISKPVAAMAVLKAVQDGRFGLDDDINGILRSWKLPTGEFTASQPVTPRSLLSHTSGLDDGFGFPGYHPAAPLPTLVQILDGQKPSNVGSVRLARPPMTAMKYSGGGVTLMQLALTDVLGRPFPEVMQQTVLGPLGMTRSAYEQPLSADRDRNAARAHGLEGQAMDAKWHVYPELEAAGLWTTPTDLARFLIEVQQSIRGRSNRVLSRAIAQEMVNPVGVGEYAVGLGVAKIGEGWYVGHGGSNWGFRCDMKAHKIKGYGVAVMTNGDRGGRLIEELEQRVESAYHWDALDKSLRR
ncbi:MAG TPA: serine hydrolase domain-containing protein [Vicinamibacterales bacterium]|jgi:CubicO group peptidase (beta-lactamase class C family)